MRPTRDLTELRQWRTIQHVAETVAGMDEFLGAILIGSFAAGTADTLTDVDLLLVSRDGSFEAGWARRRELGFPDDLYAWDILREDLPHVGAHKFFTEELVFVECLISTPSGGARLAEPFRLLVGDDSLPDRLPRRDPIQRSEMQPAADDPGSEVDKAYAHLVGLLRRSARGIQ